MSFSLRTPHQKPQLRKALPSKEQVQLSTAHEHFRQQPRPRTSVVTQAQTSTYLLAASGPLTHSWSSAASWTTGFSMASGGHTFHHSHQDGPPRQQSQGISQGHRLPMSKWMSGFILAWTSSMDHGRHQQWYPVASWTKEHKGGRRMIKNTSGLEKRLSQTLTMLDPCPEPHQPWA